MAEEQSIPQNVIDEFVGVCHGDFARVKELLEQYPDLATTRAVWGETPIEAAAQMGHVEMANYLLARGAPFDICTAAMLGQTDMVKTLLDTDPSLVNATGAHGIPILYFPVIMGHEEIAELLVERGAAINLGDENLTPLHGAVMFDNPMMVEWLLENGAQVSVTDYNGKTPLEVALDENRNTVVEILREYKTLADEE